MSFDDLPAGWDHRPIDDPDVTADVVDLFCKEADRSDGCLLVLLCHPDGRLQLPVCITEMGDEATTHADRASALLAITSVAEGWGSVVVARGRAQGRETTDEDRAWHQSAIETCRARGIRLIGCFVATCDDVWELPPPEGELQMPA